MNFTIDCDNNITAFATQAEAQQANIAGAEFFASVEDLAALAANWPSSRLIEVWNSIPGLTPVKKFTDRKTAIARIWKAVQSLGAPAAQEGAQGAPEAATTTKKAGTRKAAPTAKRGAKKAKAPKATTARDGSKKAMVLDLLRRKGGATLPEIAKATEWQNHSIRGFISGTITKKMGLSVKSFKTDQGQRAYALVQ